MALLGKGVLVIWNDIDAGVEAEFLEWHVLEHIPERVGLGGFLRGRRYVALDGEPKYFNFYETDRPETLASVEYRARLNDPTPWTRRVVARFRNTSRTVCDVAASLGRGEGAFVEPISFSVDCDAPAFRQAMATQFLPALIEHRGIVGAHLLAGRRDASRTDSAEKTLRSEPDRIAEWVVLVEAVDAEHLVALRTAGSSDHELHRHGARPELRRGIYRLQFALTKHELEAHSSAGPTTWT